MAMQSVGQMASARNAAQNQIGQYRAQQQALEQTNERQRLLRALESQRQSGMGEQQMSQFQRALDQADPSQMRDREQQMQIERQDLARRVGEQTSADSPLPGSSIPGGGSGLMQAANRVVEANLAEDAESLGERSAALNAFPESMARLGQLFQGPEFNIARLGRDSQMSRSLLPNEMDAARIAPRVPAPSSNALGQILAGLGQGLTQYGGVRQGQQDYMQGTFDRYMNTIPNTPFTPFGRGG
jgi:hypothetical protein